MKIDLSYLRIWGWRFCCVFRVVCLSPYFWQKPRCIATANRRENLIKLVFHELRGL